ncbi:MAG: fibronectin type III domain-containing protein, partial [Lachnospiraceae bacterium]|nr:fibronectin type III domain-containing protein [Lachnospiraceae bacterium]
KDGIAEVTNLARITIDGGKVHWITCGGSSYFGGISKVKQCEFVMNKGMVEGLGINGDVNGVDKGGKSFLDEVSIYINGGTVQGISDSYSWCRGSTIETNRVSVVQIDGANVGECSIGNAIFSGVTYNSLPEILPSLADGTQAYAFPFFVYCDGKEYIEKKIDSLITGSGEEILLHEAYTFSAKEFLPNIDTGKYETVSIGKLVAWLPEHTNVECAKADGIGFITSKDDNTKLTNLVPVPKALSNESTLWYNGNELTGIYNLSSLSVNNHPYTSTGDGISQINPGTYTSTFTLKAGYKWEDMTTGAKKIVWMIKDPSKQDQKEDPKQDPKEPGGGDKPLPGENSDLENERITLSLQDEILATANTDKGDPKGSSFRFLMPKVTKVKKNEITIGWKPLKEADGYVIYGAKCGSKMKKLRTIQNPKARSCTFKKLKKGTYYKYIVVAYKNAQKTESDEDGSKIVLSTSISLHAATTGGQKKNPLGISLKKSRISIKRGKSAKIRASMIKKGKVQYHIAKFRYESLDLDIATVSKAGKIKGQGKGKTKILVYTQNGIYKTVSVTVK